MYGANKIEYTESDEKYFINIIIYHAFNLLKDLFKILINNLDLLQVKKQRSIFYLYKKLRLQCCYSFA